MKESVVRLVRQGVPEWNLPALSPLQQELCEAAGRGHIIVRGAPGSGKTRLAVEVFRQAVSTGKDAVFLVPDRVRETVLRDLVQSLAPTAVRPLRTVSSLAFHIVDTWRRHRSRPLGPMELVTGARFDQMLAELIETVEAPWPDSLPPQLRELPAFRNELRNLLSRSGELGVDADALAKLGHQHDRMDWVACAEILRALEIHSHFHVETEGSMQVDLARLQALAADLIAHWGDRAGEEGVDATPPIPQMIVIDDLQDCTASTATFLAALAGAGVRIAAVSEPDIAIASYRGGEPQIDGRLSTMIDTPIEELGEVFAGTAMLRDLTRAVVAPIGDSLKGHRKSVGIWSECPDGDRDTELNVSTYLTQSQLGAGLTRRMREHFLYDHIPWGQQAVIVKSARQGVEAQRFLERAGIPIHRNSRAFIFAEEPAVRPFLDLLAWSFIPQDLGYTDSVNDLVESLISSPYIQIDTLDLSQYLRTCNEIAQMRDFNLSRPIVVADLVTQLHPGIDLAAGSEPTRLEQALLKAQTLWKAAKKAQTELTPASALWTLWEAADVAQSWQESVLAGDEDSARADAWLDSVMALFRYADIWQQRHPLGGVKEFVAELLEQDVPTDTLVDLGYKPEGVHILTPAQAVGRRWQVVSVLGLQEGVWPDLRHRDRTLRTDLLVDIVNDRADFDEQGKARAHVSTLGARQEQSVNERRLLAAAVSRSTRFLNFAVLNSEDAVPSAFLDPFVNIKSIVDRDDVFSPITVGTPLDTAGHVARLRHVSAQVADSGESAVAQHLLALMWKDGVWNANPDTWTGAGGITSTAGLSKKNPIQISPSDFDIARKCMLRWFLDRNGGAAPATIHQRMGTFIHRLAENYQGESHDALQDLLTLELDNLGFNGDNWSGQQSIDRARQAITNLYTYLTNHAYPAEKEVEFEVNIEGFRIKGVIDRIEKIDDGVRIIDFKSGKGSGVATKSGKLSPDLGQLALYQLALLSNGVNVLGGKLVYLGNEDLRYAVQQRLSDVEVALWMEEIVRVGKQMRSGSFTATPADDVCRVCAHKLTCPAFDEAERTVK